jgi:hypothetical protein
MTGLQMQFRLKCDTTLTSGVRARQSRVPRSCSAGRRLLAIGEGRSCPQVRWLLLIQRASGGMIAAAQAGARPNGDAPPVMAGLNAIIGGRNESSGTKRAIARIGAGLNKVRSSAHI